MASPLIFLLLLHNTGNKLPVPPSALAQTPACRTLSAQLDF